jgi:pyruvate,water dikinase
VDEGKRRIAGRRRIDLNRATPHQVARLLADPEAVVTVDTEPAAIEEPVQQQGRPELVPSGGGPLSDGAFVMRARQIVGQPAGRGLAMGPARVVASVDDLFRFKSGEILVCDAIDPNMTFVVPLAAAIVERRGGMLVHGAIIAREYGLPCVTGVADATALIHTGDRLTVDGYLGIVTLDA